jgi:hypothetical protein
MDGVAGRRRPRPGDAGDVIFGRTASRRRAGGPALAVPGRRRRCCSGWCGCRAAGGRDAAHVRRSVVGHGLAAPVSLRLPPGAVTLADRGYVGLRLYDGPGGVLVTVPTQVVRPSGVRADLPDDPARWLTQDPRVFVSRVRAVTVAGRRATQVDYRCRGTVRAPRGSPPSRCSAGGGVTRCRPGRAARAGRPGPRRARG